MLERVPVPLPLLGLSEAIAADQQEPGTTARALNVRGVDPRSPGRIRLAQRSGLEPHGSGAQVAGGSPVVAMFQAVKDTPPEAWVENSTADVTTAWTGAVAQPPLTAKVGPDGNCYTLLANGNVVIHSERGKLLGTIDAQAPVGFSLVPDLGIDEDGAVYTMAAYPRRITEADGREGAGRLYRFRKRDDFWERESTAVIEWRPRAFIYDRGEVLVTAARPDDWDPAADKDGIAPLERLYRYAGVKGEAFPVWFQPVANPAVALAANERGDVLVSSSRNPSRTLDTTAVGLARVQWTPREASSATAGIGVEANESLYLHLSALRAQQVQGVADGDAPRVWEEARRDPSDFPTVIDTTPRGFVAVNELRSGLGNVTGGSIAAALQQRYLGSPPPKFDTDGMQGVPGFIFTGGECLVSRSSTGYYEKETLDAQAGYCRTLFPNMRTGAAGGVCFIVNVLFRIELPVTTDAPRYVFQQGDWSLSYDATAGPATTTWTFTYPGGSDTHTVVAALAAQAVSFTYIQRRPADGTSSWYINGAIANGTGSFNVTVPQRADRTVLGGMAELAAPVWSNNARYIVGDIVWHSGRLWVCLADNNSNWSIVDTEPGELTGSAYWDPYVAKAGLNGAIAEAVVFLGPTTATPHDDVPSATLQDYVEGYTANAYGRQGILGGGHPYGAAPPPGAGSLVPSSDFGGINIPQGLTCKYARTDGSLMWILKENTGPHGNGVCIAKGDYFYAAATYGNSGGGVVRVRRYQDLGSTAVYPTEWGVDDLTNPADAWLGDRIQITADHNGDLYLPYVDAEAETPRAIHRYKFDGNGLLGAAQRFVYELGSDAYPIIALPAGLAIGDPLTTVPALWNNATTYTPGVRVKLSTGAGVVGRRYECILTNLNVTPPNATYWTEIEATGPEFIYVPAVDPSPTTSPTYSVRRVEVLRRVATGSVAPREVSLLAVTQSGTVSRYSTALGWTSVAASALPGTYVWTATLFGKTFAGNGSTYRVYDHQNKSLRAFEEATVGRIPPRCRLGCAWRGRLVIARGDSAHDWHMSAVADPFDHELEPDVVVETQAVSGASSQVGQIPDMVNALVPMSDDLLAFGCDSSVWILYGDPMTSGTLNRMSSITGMAFGQSWCIDERGIVYFLGSRGGFYAMTPSAGIQPLSEGKIHRRLQEIDLGRYTPRVVWNDLDMGAHIFLVPNDGKGDTMHFFHERATGAFWADQIHGAERQIRGAHLYDGDHPQDRALLLGCADGRVRRWSPSAVDDDGEQIRASVLVGPVTPDTMSLESRVTAVECVLARDQGGALIGVMGTDEADVPYHVDATALLNPGRNGMTRIRARGAHIWTEIGSAELGQPFAVEDLALHIAPAGRKRGR